MRRCTRPSRSGRNQTYIFEEPDEDARVPRAPISDAGRARAMEIGRRAREAATDMLTSFIAPLPHYRGQPSALIAAIVVEMARQLELPDVEVDRIRVAALLHDVGKVAVPEAILDKPAPLTSAEWRTVVQHPRIGQVILEHAAALRDAVPIILHHHERFAGHGYPYGLRANEIPLGARIVAIADAYDAMTHDRPYKRGDVARRRDRRAQAARRDPVRSRSWSRCSATSTRTVRRRRTRRSWRSRTPARPDRPARAPDARRRRLVETMAADGHGLVDLGGRDARSTGTRKGDGTGPSTGQARDRRRLTVRRGRPGSGAVHRRISASAAAGTWR